MNSDPIAPLLARIDALAPMGSHFGFHIRASRPLLQRSNYDHHWNARYSAQGYIMADPAAMWGLTHTGSVRWSAIALPDPLGIFADAAAHGLRFGATFAAGSRESRSIGSCARGDREFTDAEIAEIAQIVERIHAMLEVPRPLKPHQIEALRALADGLHYDAACARLGISRTALRNRLKGARLALHATSNAAAVRTAIEQGWLESSSFSGRNRDGRRLAAAGD